MLLRFAKWLGPGLVFVLPGLVSAGCDAGKQSENSAEGGAGMSGGSSALGGSATSEAGGGMAGGGMGGSVLSGGAGQSGAGHSGGGVGGSAMISAQDIVLDDFEDGDDTALVGGTWYSYTDGDNGGGSTLTIPGATGASFMMTGEGKDSKHSLAVEYAFEQASLTYDPYVGFGISLADGTTAGDLSSHRGIAYSYRGGAHTVRLETLEVEDYDFFGVPVPESSAWKTVILPFTYFKQEGWGKAVMFNPAHVNALSFHIRGVDGTSSALQIDDLTVLATVPAEEGPKFTLNEPAPPTLDTLPSIAIANPLQEKAMRTLNRGYNITNWLEQSRFSGFTYDEAYVEKLALAGFKSLRLPIDLDRYLEPDGAGGLNVHEDLFTVLDAFDAWTAKHGLSLTIDYHEYDKSVTLEETSLAVAIAAWGKVAEHFTASTREDLYFELFNEPELSFGGTPPTQTEWTAIAERMIAAIRAHDTTHTIIFGDVEWYGVERLAEREPLSDHNVIYAFHDYEPFIFTHQGAAWANMATTHDIPYPYSVERWSEQGADLGFTSFMESWMLSAARNYYRTGNRESLYNRALIAKRWAVQHGVPVICNEFGAYDGTSRLEDRARYYSDLIGVFEELEIPWQQWFMVMNADGQVIPEYRTAFRLPQ